MRLPLFGLVLTLVAFATPRIASSLGCQRLHGPWRAGWNRDRMPMCWIPNRIRHTFASGIYNGYFVLEVAVYPEPGRRLI